MVFLFFQKIQIFTATLLTSTEFSLKNRSLKNWYIIFTKKKYIVTKEHFKIGVLKEKEKTKWSQGIGSHFSID